MSSHKPGAAGEASGEKSKSQVSALGEFLERQTPTAKKLGEPQNRVGLSGPMWRAEELEGVELKLAF